MPNFLKKTKSNLAKSDIYSARAGYDNMLKIKKKKLNL